MPGIIFNGEYNPHSFDEFTAGDEERRIRHALLNLYWQYYEGDQKRFLDVKTGSYDDNVIYNLCGQAVERSVHFLFPEPPTLKYSKKVDQKKVETLWKEEFMPSFLTDIAISGLVSGHVFLRIDNSDENPSFINIDPRVMTVFWDVRRADTALWYRMTWAEGSEYDRDKFFIEDYVPNKYLSNVDTDEGWSIITYKWVPQKTVTLQQIGEPELWNYPFAPIVDWKAQPLPFNFYGPSLLRHLHVNDVLNFLASNTNRILRFHAHPKTIITGAGQQALEQTSIDEVWAIPTADAKVFNLEMQSDLKASMEMMDKTRAAFFAQAHVVDTTSYKDKIGQITNFGVHVLFADMVDHTKVMHQLYGRGLQEATRRALIIMGSNNNIGIPNIVWADPLPVNQTERVNAVKIEQSIGVTSPQTLSESLDRDFDQEQTRIKEGQATYINLGNQGIHKVEDLPIEKEKSSNADGASPDEWDDSDRLQRAIESI